LPLNAAHETELSALTSERFAELIEAAFYAICASDDSGFLLCFDQHANYASPNFAWFKSRYARFVYIDRVVVAPHARGRGLARAFYARLIEQARVAGHEWIVCEVNSDPPNPASDAFHDALGFVNVGAATLADRGKSVNYLALKIPAAAAAAR